MNPMEWMKCTTEPKTFKVYRIIDTRIRYCIELGCSIVIKVDILTGRIWAYRWEG